MNILNDALTIASAFTVLCVAFSWACKGVSAVKKPNTDQNKRLDDIERRLNDHDACLQKDLKRFDVIEAENHIELQALLALLEHGIDGNNVAQMQKAKETLQNYLIRK